MIKKIKKLLKNDAKTKNFKLQFNQLITLEKQTDKRFVLDSKDLYPCLSDATTYTGFDRHYVYHPAWAARIIKANNPKKHIDISSTLHFCSILSAFIPVEFYDYRPAKLYLTGLKALGGDLLNLPFADRSVYSLSCMHTVEHIGLGRYGDPLDYDGDKKAIDELKRVLAPGGNLLFVVPLANTTRYILTLTVYILKKAFLSCFRICSLKNLH
ncbi:DUF268 domain-containing protein [Pedobacter endophyticus]|uniref:DUF268 domain-containing protein n=1 Tax=Pedobacter endophyticus TaxID=2789740 RepID=UPI001E4152C3|nr:DUF268 domain-containing protein [Pedobacter endophyticus]